jgi:endonuclease/exonuclease/phosphatase family metal-dependent hydrolase
LSADGSVTILSYNVEGLPWPLAFGRNEAADAIADQLADLRHLGSHPQIVAVQEAFGTAAQAIGRKAGYRYQAFGPSEDDLPTSSAMPDDGAFLAAATPLRGEAMGHFVGSGLAIFSDFPILWVRRLAFPPAACAGFDCLANKGVLAVALAVPGQTAPLLVVDTHLNSRAASHTPDQRNFAAYRRQVDLLMSLVPAMSPGTPLLLAGDFNIGAAPEREAYVKAHLLDPRHFGIAGFEHDDGHRVRAIRGETPAGAARLAGAKSLIAYSGSIRPAGPVRTFGLEDGGHMLSDHLGVEHRFSLVPGAGVATDRHERVQCVSRKGMRTLPCTMTG